MANRPKGHKREGLAPVTIARKEVPMTSKIQSTIKTLKAIEKVTIARKNEVPLAVPATWPTQPEFNFLTAGEVLKACAKLPESKTARGMGIPRAMWRLGYFENQGRNVSGDHLTLCYALANTTSVAERLVSAGVVELNGTEVIV